MKKILKTLYKYIKNKYIITLIIFAIVITFIDNNSLLYQCSNKKKLKKLKEEKNYYINEIRQDREKLIKMKDINYLERFGREEYKMKKDSEDIFIIVYDSTK